MHFLDFDRFLMLYVLRGGNRNYRFMCLFVAKIWWMIPRVGRSASEIPLETQMLLLEVDEESSLDFGEEEEEENSSNGNKFYVLVLPTLDGAFRTTLRGTKTNELHFCYESGMFHFHLCLFV